MKRFILISKTIVYFFAIFFELVFSLFFVFTIYLILKSNVSEPKIENNSIYKRKQIGKNHYQIGSSWLKKNPYGVWEVYIEGDSYERGKIYGELTKELIQKQEYYFVEQINRFVPGSIWQHFLRLLIGFFNRDLTDYVSEELKMEMLGVSEAYDSKYNYISTKYARILNYHAAHDIGHALADYRIVGCSSFGLMGERSVDNQLLIARNFDFYVGDDFAREKVCLFMKPSKGFAFMSYSWAGFMGVASGMNEKGLTVTINAAKSELPQKAKMPISLLAREILQYCSTIKEAISLAKKREVFVSESLLISSKKDKKIIIIEKTPMQMDVYESKENKTICTNHYQSKKLKNTNENTSNFINNDTKYRYQRIEQLLKQKQKYTVQDAIQILRDQHNEKNDTLGMGNPRAINQLLAHHSIVFQPEQVRCWISTYPYQLGKFVSYQLDSVFTKKNTKHYQEVAEDPFLFSKQYQSFLFFKREKQKINDYLILNNTLILDEERIKKIILANSESYQTYEMLGKYYQKKAKYKQAIIMYQKALQKEIASIPEEKELKKRIKECKNNR